MQPVDLVLIRFALRLKVEHLFGRFCQKFPLRSKQRLRFNSVRWFGILSDATNLVILLRTPQRSCLEDPALLFFAQILQLLLQLRIPVSILVLRS